MALAVSVALGLGMTACGGGTIGYIWVLGTQYNQIGGFKVDNFTGNLTAVVNSPFSSNGTDPVALVLKPGGRYLYVVNKGNTSTAGNISLFSVGGDGVLTFQQSYTSRGSTPVWAAVDSTGTFLYVLDSLYPDTPAYPNPDGLGDITVFQIDSTTGRLQLVPNQQIKDSNQTQLTFFPVGAKPLMMRVTNGCVLTVNSGDQTVFPYAVGTSGQLTLTANSTITTGAGKITSISTNGSYVYLTDAAATSDSAGGRILPYTVTASTCALNVLTGGPVNNLPLTSNPVYSFTDNKQKTLYVLNRSSTDSTNETSSISAFTIDPTTGKLSALGTGGSAAAGNPYSVGSGPVCMVEDTSNQYVYTSNNVDSTLTGFRIDSNSGELRNMTRSSTFPTVGQPTCLTLSGSIN
ncbi:MAG: beta-propeller fold lactonase family protein [Edaphobacter sp.]|uniref:lactonase family protein n=1 Tax=Edaphobacter sp. TaxID=1934404 RepID=UPI002387CD42|nr:beta-propeller fold lactonase family protein [Edaphobacter sp.]MDE1175983.1 beta-propeller fold lactonase family protein [Edaphobacter sp.]